MAWKFLGLTLAPMMRTRLWLLIVRERNYEFEFVLFMVARLWAHINIEWHDYLVIDSTIATPKAKKNKHIIAATNIAGQNHRGHNTQIQDQLIMPISLARVKMMVSNPHNPIQPPPKTTLTSFGSATFGSLGNLLCIAEVVEEKIEEIIIIIFINTYLARADLVQMVALCVKLVHLLLILLKKSDDFFLLHVLPSFLVVKYLFPNPLSGRPRYRRQPQDFGPRHRRHFLLPV
jgi:hypothetical protein